MPLLLDTNILLALLNATIEELPAHARAAMRAENDTFVASVASLWEIAIKHRKGRLPLPCTLEKLPTACDQLDIPILDIRPAHAIGAAPPVPATAEPFDRLLLAVCAVERMKLVTTDKALLDHPLAWRGGSGDSQ